MSHFVSREPVRVQLDGSEEWIEIKPQLSVGEKNMLHDVMLQVGGMAGGKDKQGSNETEIEVRAKSGEYLTRLLEVGITGWKLLDDAGKFIDFKRERIRDLDADDPLVDKVLMELVQRNPFKGQAATAISG